MIDLASNTCSPRFDSRMDILKTICQSCSEGREVKILRVNDLAEFEPNEKVNIGQTKCSSTVLVHGTDIKCRLLQVQMPTPTKLICRPLGHLATSRSKKEAVKSEQMPPNSKIRTSKFSSFDENKIEAENLATENSPSINQST